MTKNAAVTPAKPLMDYDLNAIKNRFLDINRERLGRTQNALRRNQQDFLELLPIFFHVNRAALPGFVSKNTPAGIPLYSPSDKGLQALNKVAKGFVYEQRALHAYEIQSLFVMGSVGTIAQSEKSDFDVWICHNPELNADALAELKLKCNRIEEWSDAIGLEVHFFLMNADKFKNGEARKLSRESSGSTQHHLLLEEFYRTGLLLAGRYPAWWLVPPEYEHDYDNFVRDLLHERLVSVNEVIDFGGLASIPAEEYLGAALWQLYKGIDSPYKSVLKILLMENYASAYPQTRLLSLEFKSMVYQGTTDLDRLDHYAVLMNRLEQYLQEQGNTERLDLVRRCFYFKADLPLSETDKHGVSWRRDMLQAMVDRWGWGHERLEMLDDRGKWKIRKVLNERRILVDELTDSYSFLSNFARENTGSLSRISETDLNTLGRMLYAAFDRKAGKIELVNRGVSTNVAEPKLTFQQILNTDGEENWNLIIDMKVVKNGKQAIQHASLRRSQSVADLIAWCHFNRLVNSRTVLSIDSKNSMLTIKEIKSMLAALEELYPNGQVAGRKIEDFARPPKIVSGCVFTNVGLDPLLARSRRGTSIVSDKTDVLNFSGFSFNLARSFDLLLVTSWQEVFIYRYSSMEGLLDCLCQYLRWHLNSSHAGGFHLPSFSYCSAHSDAIAKRIGRLFSDVTQNFFPGNKLRKIRYILEVQESYFVLYVDRDNFTYKRTDSVAELYQFLSQPQTEFIPIVTDRFTLQNSILPGILAKNKPGSIQLYYETLGNSMGSNSTSNSTGNSANLFVLDQYGSVFHQSVPFHDDQALLNQFILFLSNVVNRHRVSGDYPPVEHFQNIDYCRVTALPNGDCRFEPKYLDPERLRKSYFHVQVITNMVDQKPVFTVYCDNKEFSSYDYGKGLFHAVAKYVYDRRRSGEKYPIYITDLDLAPALLGEPSKVHIIEYLNYKKRIEVALNNEMRSL